MILYLLVVCITELIAYFSLLRTLNKTNKQKQRLSYLPQHPLCRLPQRPLYVPCDLNCLHIYTKIYRTSLFCKRCWGCATNGLEVFKKIRFNLCLLHFFFSVITSSHEKRQHEAQISIYSTIHHLSERIYMMTPIKR